MLAAVIFFTIDELSGLEVLLILNYSHTSDYLRAIISAHLHNWIYFATFGRSIVDNHTWNQFFVAENCFDFVQVLSSSRRAVLLEAFKIGTVCFHYLIETIVTYGRVFLSA